MGGKIAIDDFGTGYSSLSYLQKMPVDRLKLDQSFMQRIDHEENNRIIAGAVIALGEAMKINVIAEGIEHQEQETALRELGCPEGQGYLYGMPLYADALESILRHRSKRAARGNQEADITPD